VTDHEPGRSVDPLAPQHEITERGPLLAGGGRLAEPGWARRPLLTANLGAVRGVAGRFRLKRWDYYGIWAPDLYVSATLTNLGYVGMAFAYVVDLTNDSEVEDTRLTPLGRGIALGDDSERGSVRYRDKSVSYEFTTVAGRRELRVCVPHFDDGRGLQIEAALDDPPDREAVCIATPMGDQGFYWNRKGNALPASGRITWGDRVVKLEPETCLGQLDWGRGRWPYRTHWIWASATGAVGGGLRIGLNLGYVDGDHRAATEDALYLNGRVHKLGRVRVELDHTDYRRPWTFTDPGGRLEVTLTPQHERVARTNLGIVRSEVHQMFGRYDGFAIDDAGTRIEISALPGFAEEHYARY